jgi:DNA-binding response OmpR family regulator
MTRLLVVDDDKELSAMLMEYLSSEGFEVDAAYDGFCLSWMDLAYYAMFVVIATCLF